jgi:hypothetical protein
LPRRFVASVDAWLADFSTTEDGRRRGGEQCRRTPDRRATHHPCRQNDS